MSGELFSVRQFEECGPGRIEDHGVVFEGDSEDCDAFVDAQETIFRLSGYPVGVFFEVEEAA